MTEAETRHSSGLIKSLSVKYELDSHSVYVWQMMLVKWTEYPLRSPRSILQ